MTQEALLAARSVPDLVAACADGSAPALLCFWSPTPHSDGRLGPGCLSQWWPARFDADGASFPTAEHYMMWRKALLFDDRAVADRVLAADTPAAAKELGRSVSGFDHDTWVRHRYDVVVAGSTAKFGADPALTAFLLGTADRVLVEASPEDRIWGTGFAADSPEAGDPIRWTGLNLLGFALMQARAQLAPTAPDSGWTASR